MTEVRSRKLANGRIDENSVRLQRAVPDRARATSDSEELLTSSRLHSICIVTALIAASIFTLTEHDDHRHTFQCASEMIMQSLLVVIGAVFFRTRLRLLHDTRVVLPILVMVATLTLLCEPFQRFFSGQGHPFEILVMHSQSNLMLALAVCGFRLSFQRLAMAGAVFLTIFSCTISNAHGLLPLTIMFAMSCIVWLVASWWETVDRRLHSSERRRWPLLWLATGVCVPLLLLLATGVFGANTATTALEGFMPSSGGTGRFDPFSRGGVNDGDALVAGHKNAKSFAALEDAPFMDSDKPSLYDMFNDLFDEPPKVIKDQQRAIALPPEELLHVHQKMAEAEQAGREFSLRRNEKKADRNRIQDLETHAAFYVAGQVPARFRMEVYEHFDGATWYPIGGHDLESEKPGKVEIRQIEDRHWLSITLSGRGFDMYSGADTHSLKIANLDGNVIPTPPHVVGVSIDQVDREDMYSVSAANLVSMQRKSVPAMLPIQVTSEYVDRKALRDHSHIYLVKHSNDVTSLLPDDTYSDRIRRLAEQWTTGIPRGWLQVEAVEARLRNDYIIDREAKASGDCESPVAEFLFQTKRGPEYLFASSAAQLLRSLGYSVRMVSGFYARPENYDHQNMHTAVMPADAHFWCEVFIGADAWVTVEPSPGYEISGPPPTLLQRLMETSRQIWLTAIANAVSLAAGLLSIILLLVCSRQIRERLLTWHWRWLAGGTPQQRTIWLATLIDYRLQLAGQRRPAGTTLLRWSRHADLRHVQNALQHLATVANVTRYAPTTDYPTDETRSAGRKELMKLEQQLTVHALCCPKSLNTRQQTLATT